MKRVRLVVAYDGTNYCGWQIQPNGITIESEINRCLKDLLHEDIQITGASRTDSGVHALGNIAIFDTESMMPAEKISYALNQRLPEDIKIQKSDEVDCNFHPRYCKTRKTYEYRIYHSEFAMPTKRLYSYFSYRKINVEAMKKAAGYFVGEHDFASFCSVNSQAKTSVRTIYDLSVTEEGQEIVIRVTGNGFLYNMVRIIAGTLLEVGYGKKAPVDIPIIIEGKDRELAGPTAPAHGLTLIRYQYEFPENEEGHMRTEDLSGEEI